MRKLLLLIISFNFLFGNVFGQDSTVTVPREVAEFYHIEYVKGQHRKERIILLEEKLEKKGIQIALTDSLIQSYVRDSSNYENMVQDLKGINDVREKEVKSLKRDVRKLKFLVRLIGVGSIVLIILALV